MPFTRNGVTYPTQGAYRRALAAQQGLSRREYVAARRVEVAQERLSPRQKAAQDRAQKALRLQRDHNLSLREAAKRAGTTVETVQRYREGIPVRGVYVDAGGNEREGYFSSRADASTYGRYLNAIKEWKHAGDREAYLKVREFEGKSVVINGKKVKLETDIPTLIEWVQADYQPRITSG